MNESSMATRQPTAATAERTRQTPVFQPRFDITENDQELTLHGDLPGVEQDDLDIRYENDQLVIQGKVKPRIEGFESIYQEYAIGDFHRVFMIGETIDAEKIAAAVHNGVLVVHLPKSEAAKPRRIQVKGA